MSLLNINNPFTMTVADGDTTTAYNATFRDLTKKEKQDFDKKHSRIKDDVNKSQQLLKKIKRLRKTADLKDKQNDYEAQEKALTKLYKLEDELQEMTTSFNDKDEETALLKERFEICLGGDDADYIMQLAEAHSYERVLKTIQESIAEAAEGKREK